MKKKSHDLNTFQRVKISKSQEIEDNVLHNVDKIIQGSCYQGTSKHKSALSSKNLITTVVSLCWSIISKISLWHSNDLDHIMSMGEIMFKSHNIGTFQSLDSDVINLCNRNFELHTVRKESVTISDLKCVSVITETGKLVDSTHLIVHTTNYVFALIAYLNSFHFFDPCNISCYIQEDVPIVFKFKGVRDIRHFLLSQYINTACQIKLVKSMVNG